jgi:hypothetical protein
MTPESLASCGEQAIGFGDTPGDWTNPDPGLFLSADEDSDGLLGGCPTIHSTLWNSMIAPLTVLRVTGFLWYQVVFTPPHTPTTITTTTTTTTPPPPPPPPPRYPPPPQGTTRSKGFGG